MLLAKIQNTVFKAKRAEHLHRRDREQEVRSYRKMYEPFMNDTGEARAGGFTQLEVTL